MLAMPDIVLATLNARYVHPSLGLRSLLANLGDLAPRAGIRELTLADRPVDVAEALLALAPRVVGLGVYVWNAAPMLELVTILRRLRPDLAIVLGGPEVSHETGAQAITSLADVVVCGEAELALPPVLAALLAGERPPRVVTAAPPDLARLALPYDLYDDEDVAHRTIYVETARGCPYGCGYCLAALDHRVRRLPREAVLAALDRLVDRGARHLKFVDRSFTLGHGRAVLEWYRERHVPGMLLHLELVPDRLPDAWRPLLASLPPGAIQVEVGVQSFDPAVAARINRRQDPDRTADAIRFLVDEARAHVHADLLIGLPGETLAGIAEGFDRLVGLGPQEIQVGILKRLRGTPLATPDPAWRALWSELPPYELLENDSLDFVTLQRLKRLAHVWEVIHNRGHFPASLPLLWQQGSAFAAVLAFSDWLWTTTGQSCGLQHERLAGLLFTFMTSVQGQGGAAVADSLLRDLHRGGRKGRPAELRGFPEPIVETSAPAADGSPLPRQRRFQAARP